MIRETKVIRVTKDLKVRLVREAPRVISVRRVSRVSKENKAPRVIQAPKDLLARMV